MPRPLLAVFLATALLAIAGVPAWADALDDEYAAMREAPDADRDFVSCRLDRGAVREIRTGGPCAIPCGPVCEPACPPKCWEWRVALLGWLPGLDGTTVLGGVESDVDFDWTDWFDHLENIDFALQAAVSAHYDRWTFEVAGLHMKLGGSVPLVGLGPLGIPVLVDADLTMVIVKGLVGYDVATTRLSSCSCWPQITWTAYAGARYYNLYVNANLTLPTGRARNLAETQDWIDPMVGGRARLDLDRSWSVVLEADVGGFGVGSDVAWHVLGGVEWRATRWFAIQAGWNGIDVDYETGSGDDRFVFDITFSGPYVGFIFLF